MFWLPFLGVCASYAAVNRRLRRFVARRKISRTLARPPPNCPGPLHSYTFAAAPPILAIHETERETTEGVEKVRRQKLQAAKRAAVRTSSKLVAAYAICWLPYNVMESWKLIVGANTDGYQQLTDNIQILHSLIVVNAMIDPFLYGLFPTIRMPEDFQPTHPEPDLLSPTHSSNPPSRPQILPSSYLAIRPHTSPSCSL